MPEKPAKPVPEGMTTVTPYLVFWGDCDQGLELYQKALGAELTYPPYKSPEGKIMHAVINISDCPCGDFHWD